MDINTFYSLSKDERMDLLTKSGEYIARISYYGYIINLYICQKFYIEVYYNRFTNRIVDIELVDADDKRLHEYVADLNIDSLFK